MPYEKNRRAGPGAAAVQPQPQPQPEQQQQQSSRIRSTSMSMSGSGPSPIAMQQSGDYTNQQATGTRARRDSRALSATINSSISLGSTVNLDMTQGSLGGMVDMDDNSNNNSISMSGSGRPPQQQQDLVFVDLTLRGQDPLGKSVSQMNYGNGNGGGRGRAGSVNDAAGGMVVVPEPSWGACMPIYAAYTVKSTIYVFTLAFILPLVLKDHSTITANTGLLQGSFHASDALSIVYLCYLSFLILLAPAFGALADAASPLSRRRAFHALLGGLCVGPIVLLALLSRSHVATSSSSNNNNTPWTAIIIVLGITLILAELINIPLSSEITDMMVATLNDGPTSSSSSSSSGLSLATRTSKASLMGVGLATLLIGVPVLVASIVLDNGGHAAARYACIGTVIWNLLGTLYVVFVQVCLAPTAGTMGGQPHRHQQQQQQQHQQRGRVAAAADGLGHGFSTTTPHLHTSPSPAGAEEHTAWGPLALLRILALSPPLLLHFLLIRSFYQAGLRCLTYLGATYILLNMQLETQIATNSLILGFVGVLVGTGLTLLSLSAHQTHTHKQEEASRARRVSFASQASAVGQGIAAARVDQYGLGFAASSSPSSLSSSSFSETHTPAKRPLLIALALLTIIIATCPKQVSPLSLSPSALSQQEGTFYIISLIAGLCFGFLTSYEKGILTTMLWPNGLTSPHTHTHTHTQPATTTIAGVGVCQFAGIFACLGSVLEWFPLVLFCVFDRYNVASAMWSFLLFFGLAFVVFSVIMVVERVREGAENGEDGGEGGGGEPFPDHPPGRPERSLSKRMSFFLLRSLPSHLSTIAEVESPFGMTTNTMMSASQVVVSPRSGASSNSTVSSLGMPLSDESGGGGRGGGGGRQVQLQAPPRR